MTTDEPGSSAIVFPAMGPSRFADFGKFMLVNAAARRRFAVADEALGYSVFDALRQSEDDYAEVAQIASFVTALALADWAEESHPETPHLCAGVSFGKMAAAAYAGVLPFDEAVRMVAEVARGERDYFAEHHRDIVTHSFVKVPRETLDELLAELDTADEWYEISSYLDRDLYMVSLNERALDGFKKRIGAVGGYSLYTMRPPAHASIFEPLRDRLDQEVLSRYRFRDPVLPIVSDQDGSLVESAEQARDWILGGFVRPMRWPGIVDTLTGQGVDRIRIVGRDRLLRRLKCTVDNLSTTTTAPESALRPR
ncbi:[acyl-carrier-protein] S-malonyltransferase [Streptacidiphilus sp. MAP12-16]|uniref:ACP S-malonyltransferase n=1 Tax=Streptacidiphilus sp. MAP12-16 TaxID=3156300 RepID=UPI0035179BBD